MGRLVKISIVIISLYCLSYYLFPRKNNVCHTFLDYNFPENNDNCYYDPDTTLEIPQLIEKYAGNVEIHEVTSEDGYIITMFRIPRPNPKGVILLHHSIATHSRIYLWQGNDSIAMNLWKNGFDVWLANQRGVTYSNKHVNMSSYDYGFWDFSFHEMGLYDVSNELKLIRENTNCSKVIYFGHSLGSTMGLVYSSLKPIEAKKYLKHMILLSPAYHQQYSPFSANIYRYIFAISKKFIEYFQIGSPFLSLSFLVPITRVFLRLFPSFTFVAAISVWFLCGYTPEETDAVFFNYDAIYYLNNYSWKTLFHFEQMAAGFKMYNYDIEKNLELYGQQEPPFYPIEKISVPTLIVSSSADALILQKSSDDLFEKLSPEAKIHGHWKFSGLNHLDFLAGVHRREIFVEKLFTFINDLY